MTPHSVNDSNIGSIYLGTAMLNGRLCHRWADGTVLPILSGSDNDGDDGDDGGGDDDGDDGEDDDGDDDGDEDGDGDEDDERKPSAKSQNRAHRDAARYRTQRNKARSDLTAEQTAHAATKAELEKLKKDGITDEATKTEMASLKSENEELKRKLSDFESRAAEQRMERQITEEIEELGIDGDADYVLVKLRKNDMLTVDPDDGEIEDLSANLKKLLKKGVLKKVTSGDDDNDGNDTGRAGASRSGRSVNSGQRRKKDGYDKAKLAKKYPALRDRVS